MKVYIDGKFYDEKNAKLAWERTMAHFAKHVKG